MSTPISAVSAVNSAPPVSAVDLAPPVSAAHHRSLKEVDVLFTSTNPEKAKFWQKRTEESGISIKTDNIEVPEIEDGWNAVIVDKTDKIRSEVIRRGILKSTIAISEDTTLEGGPFDFPGSGTKKTIRAFKGKLDELFQLMGCEKCVFRCSVGVIFPSGETEIHTATTQGRLVKKRSAAEGCSGEGLINTQFVPSDDPDGRTLSQMPWDDMKRYNPRGKAIVMALAAIEKKFSF